MKLPMVTIKMPEWVEGFLAERPSVFPTREDRMRLAVDLARQNVLRENGGPFGAAVFDGRGRLVAPGINMVVSRNSSVLHAEVTALILAQEALGKYDLGSDGGMSYELATAAEPCAMCFGAVLWSGVRSVVFGARGDDVRAAGFDEGPKVSTWVQELIDRGIVVYPDIFREDAVRVIREYVDAGGTIYNPVRMR